jgi:GGDEF domain-containing protein
MGFFAAETRGTTSGPGDEVRSVSAVRQGLPARFEAVAEALIEGNDAGAACAVVGRSMARDGADLGEALRGLRSTYLHVHGVEPSFTAVEALSVAWGEETLAYNHQLSCEDPLTGLASLAHLRARLTEVYRSAALSGSSMTTSHALVVIDLPPRAHGGPGEGSAGVRGEGVFEQALRMVRFAETARMVFPGGETMCQIGGSRLVVLTQRDTELGHAVVTLRQLLGDLVLDGDAARVFIEGLPRGNDAAGVVLDELARL